MKKLKIKIDKIIEMVALHFIFIIGIGATHLVAKLFSKKFLAKKHTTASWEKYLSNKNPLKMY